jgi:polyphosphate glucokinase
MNDAAMQALGSDKRGLLLFLGVGTGLGAALVTDDVVIPMELAHLSFKNGTYEDYLGVRAVSDWAGRDGRSTSSSGRRG